MHSIEHRCPYHGDEFDRSNCVDCNNAYMRGYLAKRRALHPAQEMWSRARKRASIKGIPFSISRCDIKIPSHCPALGIPLQISSGRTRNSPSLDRIFPDMGYVRGNIKVISDHANRLKSNLSLSELRIKANCNSNKFQSEYVLLHSYIEKEMLYRRLVEISSIIEEIMK